MSGFQCPYCSMVMTVSNGTCKARKTSFESVEGFHYTGPAMDQVNDDSAIELTFFKCPNCKKYTILLSGVGSKVQDTKEMYIRPISCAKKFPDYVPSSIRQDYEEACAIVALSPKASATLSRRCLQSMIRDFWQIKGKSRLVDEIDALEDKVPAAQWKVLNSLRRIGNIGAHPEADINLIIDIEPDDAQKLISIIELLLKQWYIERHEQEQLYADVFALDENTKSQKTKE